MARIKQKLQSRSGASILLAMVLLLVATMISAVIISASATTVNRVNDDFDHQQQILAVNSAARLAAKALENAHYTFYTDVIHWTTEEVSLDEGGNPILNDDETPATELVDHEKTEYRDDPNTLTSNPPASISSELLVRIAHRAGTCSPDPGAYVSITTQPYYLVIDPKPAASGPVISGAILRFTLTERVNTESTKWFDLEGTVYLVDSLPASPGAADYDAAIAKSDAGVGITARLIFEKTDDPDGTANGLGVGGGKTYTTTETWSFGQIELFTAGEVAG